MAGCIPVVEDRPAMRENSAGCPILWTTDYSEITPEYLEQKYQEMLDVTYDFSALFLSARSAEHQRVIREKGDHWVGTCVGSGGTRRCRRCPCTSSEGSASTVSFRRRSGS